MVNFDKHFFTELEQIIKKAGEVLLSYYKRELIVIDKETSYATQADIESEKFLKNRLSELMPGAEFWAEESGKSGSSQYCWVIDPLDGTTNFKQEIGYFCISVALTYLNEPIIGIIFDPINNDYFFAYKSHGAYLNGEKIFVSKQANISKSVIAFNFPYGQKGSQARDWKIIQSVKQQAFSVRVMGAAALDLANTAAGRFEGIFFNRLEWWDIAAGILMIKEAGGMATDFNDKMLNPEFESLVAGNENIYKNLINIIKKEGS